MPALTVGEKSYGDAPQASLFTLCADFVQEDDSEYGRIQAVCKRTVDGGLLGVGFGNLVQD